MIGNDDSGGLGHATAARLVELRSRVLLVDPAGSDSAGTAADSAGSA
jgi:hypothetical protein